MDRQEEVAAVSTVTLFDKYQLCGVLGTGRTGTVFLAVHLGLEEYRAVKRVPKSFLNYERFRREALVLKEFRHPGIPIVYDVEEDENYSYLIEEYLEGESLYDLVSKQGHLSQELTISYGIQLSCIMSYLHLAGPNPILHLDLQPKNLLVCHDTLKLIDFGIAASLEDANIPGKRFGTVGCAAPEQYLPEVRLDERTDIYAIGAILHYLYSGSFPKLPYEPPASMDAGLASLIGKCMKENKEERISSAQELLNQLRQLKNMETAAKNRLQSSSLTIALAGSKSGAGTTHVAIGLSVYLRNRGYPNVFEEMNNSGMGAGLGAHTGAKRDQYGLMHYHGFVWKPYYGPGVKLKAPPFSIRIQDYGKDLERAAAAEADGIILVCDGSCWHRKEAFKAAAEAVKTGISYCIIYNHMVVGDRIRLPEGAPHFRCFKMPYCPNPFVECEESERFYKLLTEVLLKNNLQGKGRIIKLFQAARPGYWLGKRYGGFFGKKPHE